MEEAFHISHLFIFSKSMKKLRKRGFVRLCATHSSNCCNASAVLTAPIPMDLCGVQPGVSRVLAAKQGMEAAHKWRQKRKRREQAKEARHCHFGWPLLPAALIRASTRQAGRMEATREGRKEATCRRQPCQC